MKPFYKMNINRIFPGNESNVGNKSYYNNFHGSLGINSKLSPKIIIDRVLNLFSFFLQILAKHEELIFSISSKI